MQKINLCVLFGGASSEHEISLLSAQSVLSALDGEKYNILPVGITKGGDWFLCRGASPSELPGGAWEKREDKKLCSISANRSQRGLFVFESGELLPVDAVFPVLHGENGEDGRVQGLLELAGLPFVGPGCAASAVSMDKSLTKLSAATVGVRQARWVCVTDDFDEAETVEKIEKAFTYPVFIKPAGTGSSVGTSKAKSREDLLTGLSDALRYGGKALVEEFIDGREIETAVLGNREVSVSVCGEIVPSREFYSYESKYSDETSETLIPARIPEEVAEEVRAYAEKIYKAIGCRGLSRVDCFVTRDKNEIVFNEINTIPGFTSISMYAKLFAACGTEFSELLDRLVSLALEG